MIFIAILIPCVTSFGYVEADQVKKQVEICLASANLCRLKCISGQEGHDTWIQNLPKSFENIHKQVHEMDEEKTKDFCKECMVKLWTWEERCLQKLYGNDFFWS